MLADILLNRINCRIVALTAANYKYAGQANLRYMSMNIVLTRRKSKKSAGSTREGGADIFLDSEGSKSKCIQKSRKVCLFVFLFRKQSFAQYFNLNLFKECCL